MKARGRWGGGRIYKRGSTWWVQFSRGGAQHRESARSRKRDDAVALLNERLRGRGPHVRRTLADLLAVLRGDYQASGRRSVGRVEAAWKKLAGFFGEDAHAESVTRERLAAYVTARLGEDAARATIRYELSLLKRAFRLADVPAPRFPTVTVSNRREVFITDAEHARIVGQLRKRKRDDLADAVEFVSRTGWRRVDVFALRWADVDEAAKTIRVRAQKTSEVAIIPYAVDPVLVDVVARRRKITDEVQRKRGAVVPLVFHRNGRPILDHYAAWRAATRAVGLPGRRFHDYRRSAARALVRAGVPDQTVMRLVGWRTRAMLDRYVLVREDDLAEALAKRARRK